MDDHPKMSISGAGNGSCLTILFKLIAGVIVCGPLLFMMGLVLFTTTTLLCIATPPLILFSPVIVPSGLAIALALAGFGTATAMGVWGFWALRCASRMAVVEGRPVFRRAVESVTRTGQVVKERTIDIVGDGHDQYNVEVHQADDE